MRLVIDASVALKWFRLPSSEEPSLAEAHRLRNWIAEGHAELFQPPHWIAEIVAVLARKSPALIGDALSALASLDPATIGTAGSYQQAGELASRLRQHVFDTLYHAVAIETGAQLITDDECYFSSAFREGSIARLQTFVIPHR